MELLIKIIQFFLCFTILVGIHEFGHFLMARLFKIRVEKFYIFFDPWFSLFKFKRGDTEYGLGWLPMGGYVKIAGMIDESMDTEQMAQPEQPDEFRAKPAWQRFLVMIAGVAMNVLLAIGIYIGVCYAWGESYLSNEDAKWGYNFSASAQEAGLRNGDRILMIDGNKPEAMSDILNSLLLTDADRKVVVLRNGEEVELTLPMEKLIAMRQSMREESPISLRVPFLIDSVTAPAVAMLQRGDEIVGMDDLRGGDFMEYREYMKAHTGDSITLNVLRQGEEFTLRASVSAEGTLGVMINTQPYTLRTRHFSFWEAIPAGLDKAVSTIASYWDQLKMIVQPKTKMYEELGGFIAIGSIFPGEWDWHDFWLKTAFLSIILAVMNILPIPGLDGGHAIFTFWEMVTGRKVSDKVLEAAQWVGLAIILLLLVYANGNDIYRLFIK